MDRPVTDIPPLDPDDEMTTQEHTYLRLRAAIMTGALPPGHKLTIRGLADQLGLSQTPVREAIRRLSSENAIEVLENRRLRVPVMTPGRFDDLVQLRVALETHAARRCLPHISDHVIDQMTAIDTDLDELARQGEAVGMTRLNHAFHRAMYCACPDHAAMALIDSIWLQLGPFQRQLMAVAQHHYSVDHHKQILSALRRRDPEGLTAALQSDIRDGLTLAGRDLLAAHPSPRKRRPS